MNVVNLVRHIRFVIEWQSEMRNAFVGNQKSYEKSTCFTCNVWCPPGGCWRPGTAPGVWPSAAGLATAAWPPGSLPRKRRRLASRPSAVRRRRSWPTPTSRRRPRPRPSTSPSPTLLATPPRSFLQRDSVLIYTHAGLYIRVFNPSFVCWRFSPS